MNRVQVWEQLQLTNPPVSRLSSLVESLLKLIPDEVENELHQVLLKHCHSLVSPQFNIEQCFQMMHVFLSFEDRIACMVVNHEWRQAIRKPQLWKTWFGTTVTSSGGSGAGIAFPYSLSFVKSMLPCWSELKGEVLLNSDCSRYSKALFYWIQHSTAMCPVYIITSHTNGWCNAIQNLLSPLLFYIAPTLVELHLGAYACDCLLMPNLSSLYFPALRALTVYYPFTDNFVNVRQLKSLNLKAYIRSSDHVRSTLLFIPYPELERITLYSSLTVTDFINVVWPNTLKQLVVTENFKTLITAFSKSRVQTLNTLHSLELILHKPSRIDHSPTVLQCLTILLLHFIASCGRIGVHQ